ncbi:Mur ligase family protein [Sulfurospirillum barnesii]|uniref:UDP-N-acetylmuramyl pentapeptide synthase n=1 Tax=Sulfurospirillum barnesii (strain ATCC 700032 / DSM 10660 / SES-3) TaxID=760154 RepID=I3XX38_SULBS|nr:UDP-N-acetylmuramoyl-tripeptide--D-alanyl-D-alanine ligase [Sulfurospirillum barnesii]AFL68512.1 UDP-N-acetylmuramyl pentapeptide synthase [Sulfurospirillum barnesii SES-3]
MEIFLTSVVHFAFVLCIGYYFMTAMQWYSYRLERILFHYNRYDWHLYFFIFPLFAYYLLDGIVLYCFSILLIIALSLWNKKNDKKLVFTARVKRFFLFLIFATLFQNTLCLTYISCQKFGIVIPLGLAQLLSMIFEKILFESYKKEAFHKVMQRSSMKVIAITASYGKTSIKNFLAQILSKQFLVYKTPRSVNTIGGIIKDINTDLPQACDVYIVEAGARLKGDIDAIARLVNPHIAIVGRIGAQHIEYFKTLENIRNTKMEMIHSNRLEKAFVHESAQVKASETVVCFGDDLKDVEATLDGVKFTMVIDGKEERFFSPLLGDFNAINLGVCIHVAKELGMRLEAIKEAIKELKGVEHRLQKIEAGGKVIIDDSFNGNLEGMLSSYALVASYAGRKVIVTPGIVESTVEANALLAQTIDDVFDLVIITGKSNAAILGLHVKKAQKIVLADKSQLQTVLAEQTHVGDLILFSNDAPSFI